MKGMEVQNLDLYNQMSLNYMHMASFGLNKKVN
jgi:hypothetical protein